MLTSTIQNAGAVEYSQAFQNAFRSNFTDNATTHTNKMETTRNRWGCAQLNAQNQRDKRTVRLEFVKKSIEQSKPNNLSIRSVSPRLCLEKKR